MGTSGLCASSRGTRGTKASRWRGVGIGSGILQSKLDPKFGIGSPDEPLRQLRGILKGGPHRTALPVTCAQIVGGSRDIWTKAQREAGFKSELQCGDLERIYYGDESMHGGIVGGIGDFWRRYYQHSLPRLMKLDRPISEAEGGHFGICIEESI